MGTAVVIGADASVSLAIDLIRLMRAYVVVWTATLTVALAVRCVPGAPEAVGGWLHASLSARANPPPTLASAAALAGHNLCVLSISLLLALSPLASGRARFAGDAVVALHVGANTALVGLAIGAYGGRIAPFVPHLPLEWLALSASLAGWWTARGVAERDRRFWERLAFLAVALLVAVPAAALLEAYATPHR